VFGKRAGQFAAEFARKHPRGSIEVPQVKEAIRRALEPFERNQGAGESAEGPYQLQTELQELMQNLVGIVRREDEMRRALEGIARLRERAQRVGVSGNRNFNPGWHTALDLPNLLTVGECITRAALERKESRGAHFREDLPERDPAFGKMSVVLRK